jgi:tRNA modification GTPase
LLNALAGQQRAVVSPQPGTTRDALSAQVALERGIAHVVDVAGLEPDPETQPSHAPDHAGSIRLQIRQGALRAIAEADLVLLVRDLSDPRAALALPRRPDLTIGTKMDLPPAVDAGCVAICICALSGDGMAELRARLDMLAFGAAGDGGDALTLNARHVSAIADARAALAYAAADCLLNRDETVALALREALDALGHVLGTVTPDDVLGRIFSRFCIGK